MIISKLSQFCELSEENESLPKATAYLSGLLLQMLDLLSYDCQLVGSICSGELISLKVREH